jgi:hypothetical protein
MCWWLYSPPSPETSSFFLPKNQNVPTAYRMLERKAIFFLLALIESRCSQEIEKRRVPESQANANLIDRAFDFARITFALRFFTSAGGGLLLAIRSLSFCDIVGVPSVNVSFSRSPSNFHLDSPRRWVEVSLPSREVYRAFLVVSAVRTGRSAPPILPRSRVLATENAKKSC